MNLKVKIAKILIDLSESFDVDNLNEWYGRFLQPYQYSYQSPKDPFVRVFNILANARGIRCNLHSMFNNPEKASYKRYNVEPKEFFKTNIIKEYIALYNVLLSFQDLEKILVVLVNSNTVNKTENKYSVNISGIREVLCTSK